MATTDFNLEKLTFKGMDIGELAELSYSYRVLNEASFLEGFDEFKHLTSDEIITLAFHVIDSLDEELEYGELEHDVIFEQGRNLGFIS